ncbi:MAG: sensor histidine kinase [Geminicoccaceae bacterium]|nr:sensor histidine kinase [Geminicoccaceae bacterium]
MQRNSLGLRLVASAALWCALLLSAGGFGLSALFGDVVERTFDQRLNVLLEGLVANSEINENGGLDVRPRLGDPRFEQPLSGWYWQISPEDGNGGRRSPSLWDQSLDVPILGIGEMLSADGRGPSGEEVRILVRPIQFGDRLYTFAVAGDRTEIANDKRRFNRLLSLFLSVMFAGLLIAIFVQVRYGLVPLRRVGTALARIRTGRARRLEGDLPHEIQPLATELNALLDHNEALIERARTHVGNLAHGLKTPLTVLTNEAERHEGPLAELTRRQTEIMRRQVDHHLARARAAATAGVLGARTEVGPVLSDLTRTLGKIHQHRGIQVRGECEGVAFRGARQDLEEMVGNLLDNACKWASSEVLARARDDQVSLVVEVEDDGPGLPPDQWRTVLERGRRLDERVPGSGLGLAIVADLAELYGGRIELGQARLGGLLARLTLPAAPAG